MQAPHTLTILASSPISLQVSFAGDPIRSLGINTLCEMNQQRWTADQPDSIEALTRFLSTQKHQIEAFSLSLYDQPAEEAVAIQPFSRPLKGQHSFFSQQGSLSEIHNRELYAIGQHWPVSCSDQERAFCVLLERSLTLWQEGRPDYETRLALVSDYAARLDRLGGHNFHFWDGDYLFAYSSQSETYPPLSYSQISADEVEFGERVRFQLTADDETDIVIVAHKSMLGALQAEPISAGGVACFNSGRLLEYCEPVDFWSEE